MIETVHATIKRYHMLPSGSRAGVAVSGGADSVFLLRALSELAVREGWQLEALHLNHKLRGEESDGDARFVAELAASLGLPCHIACEDVRARGGNLEQAARMARREFFAGVQRERGLERVATGHTLDDQAETVLFRALRGAGLTGLQGIQPVTRDGVVRPLLGVERAQLREWLRERGFEWREDSTNLDTSLARNRLRLELLPGLEAAVNRRGRWALSRLAELARDEERYWESVLEPLAERMLRRERDAVILNCRELTALEPALRRRLVRRALEDAGGGLRRIEFEHVEAVLALASRSRGEGGVQLPGVFAERSLHLLRVATVVESLERESGGKATPMMALAGVGEWVCEGGARVRVLSMPAAEATLRCWRAGDRIRLAGREREASLRDLFQRDFIPRWERRVWPVIESGGKLVWTRRYGLAQGASEDGWNVTEGTGERH